MRLFIAILLSFLLIGCQPEVPVDSTVPENSTSIPISTTTTSTATTNITTTSVVGQNVLKPSGGDDTQRLVDAVNSNSKVIVDGQLIINNPAVITASDKEITFTSRGSLKRTVRPEAVTWQVLVLKNSSNIVINNLQIVGPNVEVCEFWWTPPAPYQDQGRFINVGYNPKYESQHGLEIRGGSSISINGGRIFGVSGDGIYLDGQPNNVSITRISTECTGRSSVSNVGSSNVRISDSSFHRAGLWIINVEPYNSRFVHDYTISNTKVGYSNLTWLFASGPYFSCDIRNVRIQAILSNTGFDLAPSTFQPKINTCVASQFSVNTI